MADDLTTNAAGGDLALPGAPVVPAAPAMSMQQAADLKASFLASREKMDALMAGDVAATNEWRDITNSLWQAPQIVGSRDQVVADLDASAGYNLSPGTLEEYRRNDSVTPETRRWADARWESLIQDPDFRARFNRKETEAMKQWGAYVSIRSRPVRDNPQGEK